ncbi:uncharacterized protein EI97DRAFT_63665 [Westerdykella ornata]|uniref:N-acetyltransferase domain-containing protein n=1 Tax=Westerdykella ornata TaxID=318751 RepID=A0A6A6JGR2_WESOR|nr:uncharacterized protein EI97DRAFT_63665 [Westerdykella ornata]KAF2275537.1 hypothetical protein EI97DRAFT_63665 [Westerdykella ornata]
MAKTISPVTVTYVQKSAVKPSRLPLIHAPNLLARRQSAVTTIPPLIDGVRIVTAAEYKKAAACLAEAFAEDDVARYFIDVPDREHWTEQEKWDLHVEILEYVTYAHILKGLVTTCGEFESVALWMPPGQNMDDLWTVFRSGMWRLNYRLSAEGKRRFFKEFLPLLHDVKHTALRERDDDSWYLVYIGTRPSVRGKGHARKLIEHVTRQADREGRACYLESSNEVNPPIYRKFGFETRRTVHLQRGERNVALDIMVREPRAVEKERRDS